MIIDKVTSSENASLPLKNYDNVSYVAFCIIFKAGGTFLCFYDFFLSFDRGCRLYSSVKVAAHLVRGSGKFKMFDRLIHIILTRNYF